MKIGIVGFGGYAPRHVEVLRAHGAEVVACANRGEAGRARAQAAGIPRTVASVDELLAKETLDGVVSTASFDQQYAVGQVLLASGLPTLMEKPPGTSLAEYDALCAIAARAGTPTMVGLNRRHYSVFQRALADAGGLEAVRGVWIDWSEDPGLLLGRGMPRELVAKNVFRNSIHGLDLLVWLAGELPAPAVHATTSGDFRWVQSVSGISTRGALATFVSTWNAPGRWVVQVVTDGKRYTFAPLETCRVTTLGEKGERTIEPAEVDVQFKAGMHAQAARFLEMIRTRRAPEACALTVARPSMVLAEKLTSASLAA